MKFTTKLTILKKKLINQIIQPMFWKINDFLLNFLKKMFLDILMSDLIRAIKNHGYLIDELKTVKVKSADEIISELADVGDFVENYLSNA